MPEILTNWWGEKGGGQWLDTTLLATTNAELPGVMKSNRKFDVLLDGTILSHTTHRNAFVLTPPLRICRVRALKKKKMSTSSCPLWRPGRQRSRCLRSLITCARQDTFDAFCHLRKHLIWTLYKISCIQWWSTKVCIVLNRTPKEVLFVIRGILRAFDWTCSRNRIHKPLLISR